MRTRSAWWYHAVARDSLRVAALVLLDRRRRLVVCQGADVSAPVVIGTEPVTLPPFADLLAGPRSPSEAESCCSDADRTVYERAAPTRDSSSSS